MTKIQKHLQPACTVAL